jgi:hypothetical protein
MLRSRKNAAHPADPTDARTVLTDLESAQRRDLYAAGRGDRPRRRRPRIARRPR